MKTEDWATDILGPGFESRTIPLGKDPDGEGSIVATLVRYRPDSPHPSASAAHSPSAERPAVLWVHGMTDYFFQTHVAERFHAEGYDFFALDLRKCGRSRQEEQTWHFVSHLSWYSEELTKALDIIVETNPSVIPLGHSTAGMIVPMWVDTLRKSDSQRYSHIKAIILNSPWLGMMGFSDTAVALLSPAILTASRFIPKVPFPGGKLTTFGESIHSSAHGEFDFDTAFKPLGGHKKYVAWLASVLRAQKAIQHRHIDVGVPVLTLCSRRSILGKPYSEESNTADVVIDVKQTQRFAPRLGRNVVVFPIEDARHEVFLSTEAPREKAFASTFRWLDSLDLS